MNQPLIGIGKVHHARLRPVRHAFTYPTYFLLLPLRRLRAAPCAALKRNRFGLISFFDRDHGDGRTDCLSWLDDLLARENICDAAGEVWLHCYPRSLGHTFKPVSFWYCHRLDDSLAAIVVEVNNTFGERHCYLLAGDEVGFARELAATKAFHVSPFCEVAGRYRFHFERTPLMTAVRIDHDDANGEPLIRTRIEGRLQPLNGASMRSALWLMPLLTFGIVARIHWQAIKLWAKRVPFFRKPDSPKTFTSR